MKGCQHHCLGRPIMTTHVTFATLVALNSRQLAVSLASVWYEVVSGCCGKAFHLISWPEPRAYHDRSLRARIRRCVISAQLVPSAKVHNQPKGWLVAASTGVSDAALRPDACRTAGCLTPVGGARRCLLVCILWEVSNNASYVTNSLSRPARTLPLQLCVHLVQTSCALAV